MIGCALCQFLQLGLDGIAIALVLLHLAPYCLLLEALFAMAVSSTGCEEIESPRAKCGGMRNKAWTRLTSRSS